VSRILSLLSGSPGIGKTSAALIVARECGYEPIEVNASDTRSKSDNKVGKGVGGKLSNMIREMSTNSAISFQRSSLTKPARHVLIMDEVDGMSGGDRGGVADLIQTIKNSKVPIICICNDKYSQKLKSLRNHTIELDFAKPTAAMITKRLRMICQGEGLQMNDATMNAVIQNANGGDIRLILGTLQMIRRRTDHLSYDDAKGAGTRLILMFMPARAMSSSSVCSLDTRCV
jgi:replication factor C subunit 1